MVMLNNVLSAIVAKYLLFQITTTTAYDLDRISANNANSWTNCAGEKGNCDNILRDNSLRWIKMVANDENQGLVGLTLARGTTHCDGKLLRSDPAYRYLKNCEIAKAGVTEELVRYNMRLHWTEAALMSIPKGIYRLRYGYEPNGPYVYKEVGDNLGPSTEYCSYLVFGEPARGFHKRCRLSLKPIDHYDVGYKIATRDENWTQCGYGRTCNFNGFTESGYLIRYGGRRNNGQYYWRYTRVLPHENGRKSFSCPDRLFLGDHHRSSYAGVSRTHCEVVALGGNFKNPSGRWELVGSLNSLSGGSVTFETAYGIQSTTGHSKEQGYSTSLTVEVSLDFKIFGGSLSTTIAEEMVETMSEEFSMTNEVSLEIECSLPEENGRSIALYQWVISADERTDVVSSAIMDVKSKHYHCSTDGAPVGCVPSKSGKCVTYGGKGYYLAGDIRPIVNYSTYQEALRICRRNPICTGITRYGGRYTMRTGTQFVKSSHPETEAWKFSQL